jgi:hypothetical protein
MADRGAIIIEVFFAFGMKSKGPDVDGMVSSECTPEGLPVRNQ